MFRIGEFSKISQTPITQLRYYDRIGLFQPEHIDKFTGYRYYKAQQLPDLNRILAMKELGLTLDQIRRLIEEDVSADEIRGMLALKKAQVEQELHAQVNRLKHIEARLRQVEQEGAMRADDIVIKAVPLQTLYGFRTALPHMKHAIKLLGEMSKLLPRRIGAKKLGNFTVIMHTEGFDVENVDLEIGYLLNDVFDERITLSSGHELSMRLLSRVETAACVVRVGGMENGYENYASVGRWIETNGYKLSGPVREVYIVPPRPGRIDEAVCEIQLPITMTHPSLPDVLSV